jgi:hypothetical protein
MITKRKLIKASRLFLYLGVKFTALNAQIVNADVVLVLDAC